MRGEWVQAYYRGSDRKTRSHMVTVEYTDKMGRLKGTKFGAIRNALKEKEYVTLKSNRYVNSPMYNWTVKIERTGRGEFWIVCMSLEQYLAREGTQDEFGNSRSILLPDGRREFCFEA